jgi:MAP/microtubule affinity-regulating kinase
MFDSAGGELSDDDVEYMNEDEPIFISQGEDFLKRSSLAIYTLKHALGEGGFGSVNLYEHKLTKHLVAIKFVDLSTIVSPEDVNRVYSEIGVLRGLKHPNIVHLIDTFDSEGKICFVMEYCSGGELKDYIDNKFPMTEDTVYDLACQIAEAIRFCHNSKVIHRDLKLENILFASKSSSQIKIVDFGISGMFAGGSNGERSDAGSLLYIAPEVLSGLDNRANPALDVWSMGCIFYALLMKDLPFMAETQDEVIKKILKSEYPPLSAKISKPWHKLVKGMLRVQANKRWGMNRITEHLFKFKYDPDACVSDESQEEVEEVKTAVKKGPPKIVTKLSKSPTKTE